MVKIAAIRAGGRRLPASGMSLAAIAALGLAVLAQAQSIRMPDFRQNALSTAPVSRPENCESCGVIRSIKEIQTQRPIAVPRVFQTDPGGGPGSDVRVGAVIALPMGQGSDKSFVGGVGTPEMRERFSETTYEIVVRLDSGAFTSVQRNDGGSFRVGDRVKVQGAQLQLIAP